MYVQYVTVLENPCSITAHASPKIDWERMPQALSLPYAILCAKVLNNKIQFT